MCTHKKAAGTAPRRLNLGAHNTRGALFRFNYSRRPRLDMSRPPVISRRAH